MIPLTFPIETYSSVMKVVVPLFDMHMGITTKQDYSSLTASSIQQMP